MTADVNGHIGQKIRRRRRLLGLAQKHVAAAIGVRFQQIQKYEAGLTRISAERLWSLAQVLSVPVEYFYQGLETPDGQTPGVARQSGLS